MSIEAMKQVIELYDKHCYNNDYGGIEFNRKHGYKFIEAIEALRAAIQQAESEPVYWEWRHQGSHPDSVDFGQWSEWKRVEPRSALHTVEDALNEFRGYIARGHKYELRALYTHPAPGVPEFSRIANRKLDELQEQGFAITGYAIQRADVRGFIDGGGFVGWWQGEPDPGVPDDVVRDAERYRWLRDRDHWPAPFASSQDPEPVRGTDLDAAIDAAMIAFHAQKGGE